MIPLTAALALLTELLRAFNGLSRPTRDRLVNDVLDDKVKRDVLVEKWFGWLRGKVDLTK